MTALVTAPLPDLTDEQFLAYFWARVDRRSETDCWLWTGAVNIAGRPIATYHQQDTYAYRIAYALAHGDAPDSLCVCHRCDVPLCVNPAHLFLGSYADNFADMRRKGRAADVPAPARGEANPAATAADDVVTQARAMYATGAHTQAELAVHFGVAQSTVGRWIRGAARGDAAGPVLSVGKGRNATRQWEGE